MEGYMCGARMYMSVFVCDGGGAGGRKEESTQEDADCLLKHKV